MMVRASSGGVAGRATDAAPIADDMGALPAINRRALLTGVGLAATVASGAALVTPAMAFDATPAENAPRYKDSEHVKTFYRLAGR